MHSLPKYYFIKAGIAVESFPCSSLCVGLLPHSHWQRIGLQLFHKTAQQHFSLRGGKKGSWLPEYIYNHKSRLWKKLWKDSSSPQKQTRILFQLGMSEGDNRRFKMWTKENRLILNTNINDVLFHSQEGRATDAGRRSRVLQGRGRRMGFFKRKEN